MDQLSFEDNSQATSHHSGAEHDHDPLSGDPLSQQSNATKFKRNYRACLNCRVRKVKCDLGSVDNPRDKCARCLRERKDCVFVESKRGGSSNVLSGKRKKGERSFSPSPPEDSSSVSPRLANPRIAPPLSVPAQTSIGLPSVNKLLGDQENLSTMRSTQSALPSNYRHNGNGSAPNPVSVSPAISSAAASLLSSSKNDLDSILANRDMNSNNTPGSDHFSTMEGALVFLAKAAGTIAKADERDNIDARAKHEQIEARSRHDSNSSSSANLDYSGPKSEGSLSSSGVSSPLTSKPANSSRPPVSMASSIPPYIKKPTNRNKRMAMPAAESGEVVRPKSSNSLSNIDYIGGPDSILTQKEAERLINLFFTTMHPYFPHVPKFLHSAKVLSGYPILLCAILTISARYHPFENNTSTNSSSGVPRNIEVHDRLWLYVQRLISQTVWAEASTRSIGTVFAFLLFTEWNPRAIHWRWSDYANKADEACDGIIPPASAATTTSDEPTGLGAMRRSYRMAWMLIGSAVRLAQDTGFMEISSKTFLATHVAEINGVMNISRRSMLAHSLSEVDLDEDEITEEDMEQGEDDDYKILRMSEEDLKKISNEHVLKFTRAQKAKIELLQIMSLGHESLYGYKAQLGSLTQRQNLSVLNIMSPLLKNWRRKYLNFLVPSSHKILKNVTNLQAHLENQNSKVAKELENLLENESFIFEFNYAKLYIYSLALSPSPKVLKEFKQKKINLKLDEISKSAKYIEQAFNAANEMLLVAHRIHKLKLLRFMPVRWLTRIVRAVAFIVKCYLTITAHKSASSSDSGSSNPSNLDSFDSTILSLSLISIDEIIQSIQRAAITLRDCSPDELHLCARYSNVLMYLCSEMKTKAKFNAQEEILRSEQEKVFKKPKLDVPQQLYGSFDSISPRYSDQQQQQFQQEFQNQGSDNDYQNQSIYRPDINQGFQQSQQQTPSQGQLDGQQILQQQFRSDTNSPVNYFNQVHRNSTTSSVSNSNITTPLNDLMGDSEVMDWFINNRNIGLDFVVPWTEMIEQQLNSDVQFNFDEAMS